ncbi:alkaline-phosphatase-like protein [Blyttiomyces helicus]|uniref:Alkaline-phosphatase-like protein n=1 Tax=Blyttiomyces helicus TaxID=388810 RepID=A0A4P9WLK5_9FUNG|nr:alkaline-phosphatase-like protein [Blyttiomyces helicus]|eukprot:RKO91536.1 alkaline-phosphatase-like protein [Blyttiomyces helicus]
MLTPLLPCRTDGPCTPQPTIFTLLRAAHPSTTLGAFFSWRPLRTLLAPTLTLNTTFHAPDPASIAAATAFISTSRPELTFVHIGAVDEAGHQGDDMVEAVARADALVGEVVKAVEEALERAVVVVISDHGRDADGVGHGGATLGEVETQVIAWGHNIRRNHQLLTPLRPMDLTATALTSLGVPLPLQWTARPIPEIFTNNPIPSISPTPPKSPLTPWIYRNRDAASPTCVRRFSLDGGGWVRRVWAWWVEQGSFLCGVLVGAFGAALVAWGEVWVRWAVKAVRRPRGRVERTPLLAVTVVHGKA